MREIIIKIEWDTKGLTPQKVMEGVKWYLKDLNGNHTVTQVEPNVMKSVCIHKGCKKSSMCGDYCGNHCKCRK